MALDKKIETLNKAFSRLKEAYEKTQENKETDLYVFFRDSSIQRFEFTVEALWKTIKVFLKEKEGIDCYSPKSCIRELFLAGYTDEKEAKILLSMIDDRNQTSHTYYEEVAEYIFKNLGSYIEVIEKVLERLKNV